MRTGLSSLPLALIVATLASAQPNTISTYAGGGPVNGPALSINVAPLGVAATANGDVYFASLTAVYKVSGGIAILIAGTPGIFGFNGDNGPAARAALSYASGVAVDGSGNIYIEDSGNNRIRKVSATTGLTTTVAGNGSYGYRGDEGPATNASLRDLNGVAADGSGNIYIADAGNHCVRKVSADTGVITTIAGNGNGGFSGDGGPATSANLSNISGVAVDGSGNVYIADKDNGRVRKVFADTGVITTVAGGGTPLFTMGWGPAPRRPLYNPPPGVGGEEGENN